jgi:hypothetical protein
MSAPLTHTYRSNSPGIAVFSSMIFFSIPVSFRAGAVTHHADPLGQLHARGFSSGLIVGVERVV